MEAAKTADAGPAVAPVKPGYKTTEFWMTAGATLVGLALASGAIPEAGIWPKVVGLVVAAFTAMGYTVSRGLVKKGDAMWQGLVVAILDWLIGRLKRRTRTAGADAEAKPGLRERLNSRLTAWKASVGAP